MSSLEEIDQGVVESVQREVGWKNYRWKPISELFNARKATGAILEFLEQTEVGKMRGGGDPEEHEAEVVAA